MHTRTLAQTTNDRRLRHLTVSVLLANSTVRDFQLGDLLETVTQVSITSISTGLLYCLYTDRHANFGILLCTRTGKSSPVCITCLCRWPPSPPGWIVWLLDYSNWSLSRGGRPLQNNNRAREIEHRQVERKGTNLCSFSHRSQPGSCPQTTECR